MEDTQFNMDADTVMQENTVLANPEVLDEDCSFLAKGKSLGLKGGFDGMSKKNMENFENIITKLA